MTTTDYLFSIHATQSGDALREMRMLLRRDDALTPDEVKQLEAAIDKRFCELNAAAVGPQKARW